MSLASLLSSEQIIPEMQATERWPAIVELIDLLVSQDRIAPASRDGILAALKQREETIFRSADRRALARPDRYHGFTP